MTAFGTRQKVTSFVELPANSGELVREMRRQHLRSRQVIDMVIVTDSVWDRLTEIKSRQDAELARLNTPSDLFFKGIRVYNHKTNRECLVAAMVAESDGKRVMLVLDE